MTDRIRNTDAEWYCRTGAEEERFYDIFFKMCRKYNVNWASADEREKAFVEEVTRVTYEREYALRTGIPLDTVKPAFAS